MKKKILQAFICVLAISAIYSCTPESMLDSPQEKACCGEGENIPPPPPPPPTIPIGNGGD